MRTVLPVEGRFLFHDELVTTGVAVAAGTGTAADSP
jgi:hypothetical protein